MNADSRRHLEDLLDREIDVARALADILITERAALTGTSPEAVEQRAAEKIHLLAHLEKLEKERLELCPSHTARALPASISQRWRALLDVMVGCRKANEVNGHIIRVRQNQIRQLIDIVRGGAAPLYGPQGKTAVKAHRALARA